MKRLFAAAAALVIGSGTAFAANLPDYDAFYDSHRSVKVPGALSKQTERLVKLGNIAHVEERLGVPTFFWANQDPNRASLRAMGLTPAEAARRHLFTYAELYRQTASEMAEAPLKHVHDTGRGAIIATFSKKVNGTPVFRDEIHVIMDRDLNLVALTGYTSPHQATKGLTFKLSRATAIAAAFQDLTGQAASEADFAELPQNPGGYYFFHQKPVSEGAFRANRNVRVKDVLFSMPEGLVPAYYVEVDAGRNGVPDSDFYSYVISAVDGSMLFRRNLTDADSYTYKVWAETNGWHIPYDGPVGPPVNAQGQVADATPHPTGTPNGFQAPFVPPNNVTVEANPFSQAATDFWLPSNATATTGNNVEAYADISGSDGFDASDVRGVPNGTNAFDYTFDVTLTANANATQRQAAITQLFFNNNFMHDWYYDHGFDELAGNAQTSNYGRGGLENDSIKAEAQDFSGSNNANMSTPADGDRPRMQQYLFISPDESAVTVTAPAAIAGNYVFGSASFGPPVFDITADVVYPLDASGQHTACAPAPTFAPGSLTGKIAMIDRGTCSFAPKTAAAEAAGAIGVIMVNNNATTGAPGMGNTVPPTTVNIPAVMLSLADGAKLKNQIASAQTVNVHMKTFARDGTIDNQIVAHEWAHYLSNRSIGDAAGLSNNQGRSMGEGWSDFNALIMTVRDADRGVASNPNFSGVYATAYYVEGGAQGTNQGAYYGIRRVPYSTDLSKNGLTFKMIQNNVPLTPVNGYPAFTVQANGIANSEVHNSGEVWCTMLWEGFVGLLNATSRYNFLQAQDTMKDYFVASLQATPNAPTMLEARDALLAVVYASNKQDFTLFTTGFAKRGAGVGAVAPDRLSTTHSGTVQSFDTGGDAQQALVTLDDNASYCDHDGTLDNGETGNFIVTVKNLGWTTLSQLTATVTSPTPGVTVGNNGVITFSPNDPFTAVTGYIPVTLTGATGATPIELDIAYEDPTFPQTGTHNEVVKFLANADQTTATSATDDAESTKVAWTFDYDHNLYDGDQFQRVEFDVQDHAFWGPNPSAPADIYMISPPLNVATTGNFGFTFNHIFDFEGGGGVYYDGAILEISTDAGQTWTKIPQTALSGQQYNVTLDSPGNNPLAGQLAFGGTSPGFPNFVTTTVDLGTQYAGQTVQVRFRAGGDDNTAYNGWYIDNIAFTGTTNTPFSQVIGDQAICVNRPPVAKVGLDQTVDERTPVVLDASGSTDPDGDTLTFTWTQVGGAPVTFTGNGTFVAPEVQADTQLTFMLVASDGQLQSTPVTTHVLVKQVNRKPTAVVPAPFTVDERTSVTLDGSKSFDIDGDALVGYQWTQVSGPSVTLDATNVASPTFTAPEVMADTKATFQLLVTDGSLSSDPVELEVTFKQVNRAPMVSITPVGDSVDERTSVTLVGTAIDPDGEDAPNLLYVWSQEAGPKADITADNGTATFTAPDVKEDTPVTFKLTVYDGDEARADRQSGEAEVTFTVRQVNRVPNARAGADRTAAPGTVVGLGDASSDPDGDALTFTWKQVDGPEVTLEAANARFARFTVPDNAAIGTAYTFELSVDDGQSIATDQVTVTVGNDGTSNTADSCGCNANGRGGIGGTSALLVLGALALLARRRRVA